MERTINGQIHTISSDHQIISLQVIDKLEYYYLQPRFIKKFRNYLFPGVFVSFNCEQEKKHYRRKQVSKIISFNKIVGHRYHRKFSYYDHNILRQKIFNKISEYDYRLYLDLEMTMQRNRSFIDEIIQVGAILVDQDNQEVYRYNEYIKPTKIEAISPRTFDFLGIDPKNVEHGIDYDQFYNEFTSILKQYNPAIIYWGANDRLALRNSYKINNVKPLFNRKDFINLQKVHKDYFNLNNELGLFNTYRIYGNHVSKQQHDALVDAQITRRVFDNFFNTALHDEDFDFKTKIVEFNTKKS